MFENKVVVVTGGAAGIGKCIAEEFTKTGAMVAVIDKNSSMPNCDFFYCGDIAEESVLQEFSDMIIEKYSKVDYLINNACITKGGIFNCGYSDFLYVQKIGVLAPYILTKLFQPYFSEYAAIVNISSTRAFQSQANTESYSAAKGGISALTHALAISLAGKVRVNSIAPGWIDTTGSEFSAADNNQHPVGRIGQPIDIAKMTMFLCSEQAGFISGENINIDGGMSKYMIYNGEHGWNYQREK